MQIPGRPGERFSQERNRGRSGVIGGACGVWRVTCRAAYEAIWGRAAGASERRGEAGGASAVSEEQVIAGGRGGAFGEALDGERWRYSARGERARHPKPGAAS